jgi:hypothetical protein
MHFETDRHYVRKTIIKDMEHCGPTKIKLSHFANKDDTAPYSIITIDTGACHIHVRITPTEARDLATNLQAHAEEVDAHALQFALDEVAA